MFRRFVPAAVAGLVVGGLIAVATAAGGELRETVKRVKPAIVGVGSYQTTRRPPAHLLGTGFVVADGLHVLTNAHVIPEALDESNREFLAVFVGVGESVSYRRAERVAEDRAHDVAVLRISGPRLPSLILGEDATVEEGQPIAFTGFPIGAVLGLYPVTHRGIVSARTPVATPAISPQQLDAAMIRRLSDRYEVFQLDATAYPGNSGSPLYDPGTGRVYGVISSVFVKQTKENLLSDPSGITYAIPIRYARDLLEHLGLVATGSP